MNNVLRPIQEEDYTSSGEDHNVIDTLKQTVPLWNAGA